MSTDKSLPLFYAGRLTDAIAAAAEEVRKQPADVPARIFLTELLCFAGDFERADKQLDLVSQQDPKQAYGVALVRQLLRAEQARQQLFTDGRLPEFMDKPSDRLQLLLQATIALRENKEDEAAELVVKAFDLAPPLEGTCDDRPFVGLRDVDDLTATVLEVLTKNGKYYWVPMEQVERIELEPHRRARDLLWREAKITVRGGPDEGEVYLPVLYPGSSKESDERLRLGQMTDWRGGEGRLLRGVGQRLLQVGEEERAIMEIKTLTIGVKG
jgi:type VI secretion system protein ImpE